MSSLFLDHVIAKAEEKIPHYCEKHSCGNSHAKLAATTLQLDYQAGTKH